MDDMFDETPPPAAEGGGDDPFGMGGGGGGEEALPTFGDSGGGGEEAMPAADDALPTFGEPEPAAEPAGMGGMGGGLGAEFSVPEPECEAVIQWRAANDAKIAAKAAAEATAVAEKIAQAKTDLEQFYAERDAKVRVPPQFSSRRAILRAYFARRLWRCPLLASRLASPPPRLPSSPPRLPSSPPRLPALPASPPAASARRRPVLTAPRRLSAQVKARATGNREEEQRYIADRDAAILADSWESVCKLVDLKEKADSDTARMRNVLIQLKHVK